MALKCLNRIAPGLLLLVTCTAIADCESPPELDGGRQQAADSWRERRLAFGKETYDQFCAACHDEGVDGAPAKGDRQAWSQRSPLWNAVLFEHAKTGYLEMPARGSHSELSELAVDAATEYMLSTTFPKLPLD